MYKLQWVKGEAAVLVEVQVQAALCQGEAAVLVEVQVQAAVCQVQVQVAVCQGRSSQSVSLVSPPRDLSSSSLDAE